MTTKTTKETMTKKTTHKITIVWGTDREEEKTYSFHNKTELECFVRGVEESNGWLEYDIVNEQIKKVSA